MRKAFKHVSPKYNNVTEFDMDPLPILPHKRVFDCIASMSLLVFFSPVFVFFLFFIFFEHCLRLRPFDPLIYSEKRISHGRVFRMYKFNIFDQRIIDEMRRSGVFIHTKTLEEQGHLIVVGKMLKQIYLDELPQLWNVLKGEMSLVGPRPVNKEVFEKMKEEGVPPQALLLSGMTGNFQSYKDSYKKSAHELDSEYVKIYQKSSGWRMLGEDIKIILRTIKVVLRARGV